MKRKVDKNSFVFTLLLLSILVFLGFFYHSLSATSVPLSATAAIETGKTQLFQRTVSGALSAYETFRAAQETYGSTAADAEKIKLRVYLAFTRILDVVLRNDGGSVDTLTELLAQYGITRTGDAFDGIKFDLPLNDDGKIILPSGAPASAEALQSFFAGPFLAAVNASIADIDAAIALCPTTGEGIDREIISKTLFDPTDPYQLDVEMDAGDYYLFRAALKLLKIYALMSAGYNSEISIRDIVALANMEMNQRMLKLLLDRYTNFLKVLPNTGAQQLNDARLTLIDAIADYETASARIRSDNSLQAGAEEMFSFDVTDLQREVFYREQIALVKDSLQNDKTVAVGGTHEWWNFSILTPETKNINIELQDSFSYGSYNTYSLTGCDSKFGCGAWLEYAVVSGNNIGLFFNHNYPYGWSVFQGTLDQSKTQITGTYNGYSSSSGGFSGTFSAVRTSVINDTTNINIFPLFGNVSTPPKALRDMLPQLNGYGYPVPGTMGNGLGNDPTLGGILPDFTTQDQWLRDMDGLFIPAGPVPIADRAINVQDELITDWIEGDRAFTDITGEVSDPARDIQSLYLAKDATYLYLRIDTAGTIPMANIYDWLSYYVVLKKLPGDQYERPNDLKIRVYYNSYSSQWMAELDRVDNWGNMVFFASLNSADFKVFGNHVEMRVSLAQLALAQLGSLEGRFLKVGSEGYSGSDDNPTCLQIQPTASVTGNLTIPGYDGVGPVRIGVFEYGPDFSTDPMKRIGAWGGYPDSSGNLPATYTISGLPVGQKVFVTVFWDRDNNGVISPGDYTNFYQPFTTVVGAYSLNLATSDDHTEYPAPRFYTAVVYHEKRPPPPTGTGNWNVVIAAQLTGPSPEDVTVTVTGPGGEYTLTPGAVISKRGLVYRTAVYSLPNGDYIFTAVDSLGRKTEATYHYEERYDLPDIASLTPASNSYVGTTTPTLSWTKPAEGYAYQVWIVDYNNSSTGVTWYVSNITTDTSVTVPAGVLLPDTPYWWFVRLYDRANNPMNYTMSPINAFYTGAYAAAPVFSSVQMGARPPTGLNLKYSNFVDAKVQGLAPWDVTAWRFKKGVAILAQGATPYFDVSAVDSLFSPGFQTDLPPSDGNDYSFEMDIKRPVGSITTIAKTGISFAYKAVQAVDLTSLVPSSNYYFKTSTPTFSWRPVSDSDTYYRLQLFDPLWGRFFLWKSTWSKETSVTVPAGVLIPGGTYYWTVRTTPAINPSYVRAYTNTEGNSANRVMYRFTLEPPVKGDVSGNGVVNLEDAILALQIVSGFTPTVTLTGDVNTDNRIGLPEAIYILQEVSGLR